MKSTHAYFGYGLQLLIKYTICSLTFFLSLKKKNRFTRHLKDSVPKSENGALLLKHRSSSARSLLLGFVSYNKKNICPSITVDSWTDKIFKDDIFLLVAITEKLCYLFQVTIKIEVKQRVYGHNFVGLLIKLWVSSIPYMYGTLNFELQLALDRFCWYVLRLFKKSTFTDSIKPILIIILHYYI